MATRTRSRRSFFQSVLLRTLVVTYSTVGILATVLVALITVGWVLANNPSLHPEYLPAYAGIVLRAIGNPFVYIGACLAAVPVEAWAVMVLAVIAVAAYARSVVISDRRPARARCPRR